MKNVYTTAVLLAGKFHFESVFLSPICSEAYYILYRPNEFNAPMNLIEVLLYEITSILFTKYIPKN